MNKLSVAQVVLTVLPFLRALVIFIFTIMILLCHEILKIVCAVFALYSFGSTFSIVGYFIYSVIWSEYDI